jgi:selenocysteine lyase/cysteine desulfurase
MLVPTAGGFRPYVNLDNAASTPTFEPIWEAARRAWRLPEGSRRELAAEVQAICADFLGAPRETYDLVFTANTTEAINLAAESLRGEPEAGVEPVVLNTFLEHNSNELPWRALRGYSQVRLPVDEEGFVDLIQLEALLAGYNQDGQHGKKRIRLVAVSGASNVLGTYNDLQAIARIAHQYGARLLVDGAQMVAHRKVEMEACGIDYYAFSAHKIYAPFGAGALIARKGLLRFSPAEMERICASGEENTGGIAALGKALVLLQRIGMDVVQAEEAALTARALRGLANLAGIKKVYGVRDPAAPRFAHKGGVIAFTLEAMMADRVARGLAERGGIGIRGGCHCAHLLVKQLVGVGPRLALFQGVMLTLLRRVALPGVARVSLGIENSAADVDRLLGVLGDITRQPMTAARTPVQQQMDAFVRDRARLVYPGEQI